jgi:hypothetical protein
VGGHLGGESSGFREEMLIFIAFTLGELSLSFAVIDDCSSLDIAHSIRCIFFCHISSLPKEGCRFITRYSNQLSRLLKVKMEQNCTTEATRENVKEIYVQLF